MKTKLFKKVMWMVIPLLTMFNINVWGTEETAYTLSATNTGSDASSTGYASEKSTTISSKTWVVIGNSNMVPWRIGGGKNTEGSSTNRYIYSQTAISENITKVVVTHDAKSNITVNSVTLNVYSTAAKAVTGGEGDISSVSVTYVDDGDMTFNRPDGKNWANRFFRIDYALTWSSSKSAKYIQFSSAEFKYESAPSCSAPAAPTISGTAAYTVGQTITLNATCATGADASTTYTWYKGSDWPTAHAASPVQAAATGPSGYTFTKTAEEADAGTYWCEASNGSGCEAHNSTVKAITVSCVSPNHVDISGRWDRFGGETISLTATAYSSAGTGSPIADANITGWQWQKYNGSSWDNVTNGTAAGVTISGATTKNLQISNCSGSNSGTYRCTVSTGSTCSTSSSERQVKVYVLECYTGGTTTYNFTRDGDNQRGSVEITLSASTAYTFKVHADNDYYGNNGTVNEDVTNWVMCNNSTTACTTNLTVNSGLGGTFTFTMDYSTSGSSSVEGEPELSITYPRKTIYLTPGVWNSESAKFAFYYFRKEGGTIYGEGFTDFITPSDCGSSAEIPQWNGVKINAVRLNSSTTASDLTNSANHYKAAWDKKWNQTSDITVTSNNSVTITDWGSGDSPYTYGTFSTPTYTISYDAGTSGSGSKSNESKTCGVDFTLPNSQVFTRNGYEMDGWATSDGGDKVYDLGESYTTNAAQTFYPHWREASYTVTLTTNGGTINAGNVTSYTFGTGATLPTNVTKDHATFQGWYASSTFEGERVYSIGTTEYGNKQYYAKWEDIKWTVTWKANGATVRTDANIVDGNKVASVPSAPSNLNTGSDGCDAEFVGWVIEANDPGALSISSQSSTPSGMFTNVAGSPAITANTTFIAIYRQEQ